MKRMKMLISALMLVVLLVACADKPTPNEPTETTAPETEPVEQEPIFLDAELCVTHIGNFTGRYVEDGSDEQVTDVCAVQVENRGDRTVQLAQFQIISDDVTYEFLLTTLPPGQKAIVQESGRQSYTETEVAPQKIVQTLIYFDTEPSLYEEVFAVTGMENGLELRNLTDQKIEGPIYVYYKTRTADGFAGGITYRIEFPGLEAGESYQTAVQHFWLGSSQVMFIAYVQ